MSTKVIPITIYALIVEGKTTEQTSAVGEATPSVNTNTAEAYVIDRIGKAVIQMECH